MLVVSATPPVSLRASHYTPTHPKNYLTPFFRYACAHLSPPLSLSPFFSTTSAHLRPKHPRWGAFAFRTFARSLALPYNRCAPSHPDGWRMNLAGRHTIS